MPKKVSPEMKRQPTNMTLPKYIVDYLDVHADANFTTRSSIAAKILDQFIKNEKEETKKEKMRNE